MASTQNTQTQQAWSFYLQVGSNAENSRDERSVLVDSACEAHKAGLRRAGRKVEPSSPLNIIAAGNQSIEGSFEVSEIGKTIFVALRDALCR